MGDELAVMGLDQLRVEFGDHLADALARRIGDGVALDLDPTLFALEEDVSVSVEAAEKFLSRAAELKLLERAERFRCSGCQNQVDPDVEECPHCHRNFQVEGIRPVTFVIYCLVGQRPRQVSWMVVVHGFNTAGEWQEEFSWRIATKFKESAPVFIYKYGLIRFGVLARWRHMMMARQLGKRISHAVAQAREQGFSDPPDVVIHSFGSHLFALLLGMRKRFPDLRFGRVIATGTIIDPHFNWSEMIDSNRIEAVLNHCGGRDWAVPFAQFFIPGTGPGARKGFSDWKALNLVNRDYGHSGCFTRQALTANLDSGGAWDRFLQLPPEYLRDDRLRDPGEVRWRRIPRFITFPLRLAFILALVMAAMTIFYAFALGLAANPLSLWVWAASLLAPVVAVLV